MGVAPTEGQHSATRTRDHCGRRWRRRGIRGDDGTRCPLAWAASSSVEGNLDVQASHGMSMSGGSVLGIFQGQSGLISRILDGLDEDMVMEAAEVLPTLTDFVDLDGSPEEKWRQFLASTVADQVRATLEPFVEQMKRHEEEMNSLFSKAFEMSERTPVDQPFTSEPTPWEIKSWSAVVAFWIMTALGTEWMISDFHLGVIFTVLGVLIALFYNCFK